MSGSTQRSFSGCHVACAIVALLCMACEIGRSPNRKAAEAACQQWLQYLEDGQYDAAYDEASTLLKKTVSKKGWAAGMKVACEKRGPLVSRKLINVQDLPQHKYYTPVVDTFIFSYETVFQNVPASKEEISVVRDVDGRWRAYLYLHPMRLGW